MSRSVCMCARMCDVSRVCCGSKSATEDCEVCVLGFITNLGCRRKKKERVTAVKKGCFARFMRLAFEQHSVSCQTLVTHTENNQENKMIKRLLRSKKWVNTSKNAHSTPHTHSFSCTVQEHLDQFGDRFLHIHNAMYICNMYVCTWPGHELQLSFWHNMESGAVFGVTVLLLTSGKKKLWCSKI